MTSPSTRVTQGAEMAPCSARISAMGRSLAWVQAWKAATSWAWLISPVWSASNPKSRSRDGSRGRGMIVSSPAGCLRRTILARSHTGFRGKKWRRVAAIVTRCRPDCWGSLFRGGFSVWEPREPPCAVRRKGELPRVVLGKDVPGLIALHTRSSNLVPAAATDRLVSWPPTPSTSCYSGALDPAGSGSRKTQQQPPTRETPASIRSTRFQRPPDASRTAPTATGHRKAPGFPPCWPGP